MTNKILKFELFTLFLLTILSFIFFYYGSGLPDNLLKISSSNSSFNIITFYFSSLIAYSGYFVGPWIFFTFIIYSLFYSIIFSQREYKLDSLTFALLVGQNVFLFFLIAPQFLGEGLVVIIRDNFSNTSCVLYAFLLSLFFFASVYRENFFIAFKTGILNLLSFIKRIFFVLLNFNFSNHVRQNWNRYNSYKSRLTSNISNFLQKDLSINKKNQNFADNKLFNNKICNTNDISTSSEMTLNNSYISHEGEYKDNSLNDIKLEKNIISLNSIETKEKIISTQNIRDKKTINYFDLVKNMPEVSNRIITKSPDDDYFSEIVTRIERKLHEFKIDGKIVNILKGPVVDTYELELGVGVRISKVISSENDLSMALFGAPIRIVYPMIGRTTVGIEVPRNPREIIYLDKLFETKVFKHNNYFLPVVMGKDAFGEPFIKDLASMPHMLVAGSTGSGKSVFINTVLVSLLVKKSPSQMKLILIDPKQLELALYSKLPHLLLPVVTKAKNASISLLWAVEEMERRYSLLKDTGVRNLEGFNIKIKRSGPDFVATVKSHYDEADDNTFELPYIVIIVDEFADLILSKSGKDIETNICRLAAKARAAGIHLILATQRPSVDVVTGLIKANFPIRVSFKVTSSTDSRTILDTKGAEKLLGKGDMIFKHSTNIRRVHSAYIGEEEIEVLAKNLENVESSLSLNAMNFIENQGDNNPVSIKIEGGALNLSGEDASIDDIFNTAVKVVIEQKTASASMLQRRLRIGYNRAANLIEEMESKGIVGPAEGSKRRKVLVLSDDIS